MRRCEDEKMRRRWEDEEIEKKERARGQEEKV